MDRFGFKQQTDKRVLDIYIYEDIQGSGYDWWTGKEIESETSAKFFKDKLSEFKDVEYINIYINSFGGSVYEAYAICSQLQRHSAEKTAYIDGFACSAASLIPMVCQFVKMPSNTMMMIHEIGEGVYGNAKELRKEADNLDKMMEANCNLYLAKGNITREELVEMLDKETWLTAQECFDMGFCDEIINPVDMEKSKEILQKNTSSIEQHLAQRKVMMQMLNDAVQPPISKPIEQHIEVPKEEVTEGPNILGSFLLQILKKEGNLNVKK